jgi:hypothetical protein
MSTKSRWPVTAVARNTGLPMHHDPEYTSPVDIRLPMPLATKLAGIAWTTFGCLFLLVGETFADVTIILLLSSGVADPAIPAENVVIFLFGLSFICMGMQTLMCNGPGIVVAAVTSAILGFVMLAEGWAFLGISLWLVDGIDGDVNTRCASLIMGGGAVLVCVGGLACWFRDRDRAWRKAKSREA